MPAPITSFRITCAGRLFCRRCSPTLSTKMSRYEQFDRSRLLVKPLAERKHDLHLDRWLGLEDPTPPFEHPDLATVAARLTAAKESGAARILMMGAHVL